MSIIVNGTTIPSNIGSIIVNGVKIEKVICNGVVVFPDSTEQTKTFIVENGVAKMHQSNFITKGSEIHPLYTGGMSTDYYSNVNTSGTVVYIAENSNEGEFAQYVKFSNAFTCNKQYLFLDCHCVLYEKEPGAEDENAHSWSRGNIYLVVFDSSNNIIDSRYLGNFGRIPKDNREDYPDSFLEDVTITGQMELPSTGTYYLGYAILMNASCPNKFKVSINNLYTLK